MAKKSYCNEQMKDNSHNILGFLGEELAVRMLRKKGYKILERNWKLGDLETDIIAQTGDTLVFAEVKTRTAGGIKTPEQAVDKERQIRLTAGAKAYINFNRLDNPWRFDIIAIEMKLTGPDILHIEDAFLPQMKTISKSSFSGENRWKQSDKSTRFRSVKRK